MVGRDRKADGSRTRVHHRAVSDVRRKRANAVRALLKLGAKADLDELISKVKWDMEKAPLAEDWRKKEWLDVLDVIFEYKKIRAQPRSSKGQPGQSGSEQPGKIEISKP